VSDEQSEFVAAHGHGQGAPLSAGAEALFTGKKGDTGDTGDTGERGERGEGITVGALRAVIFLFMFASLVGVFNLWWTSRQVGAQHHSVIAQCKFDYDLSGLPVTLNPATGKPSLLGVQIVSDSRVAWRGLGCPGRLAPPAPSFARWARYYHLPAS
jgi:hypothetical protein